MKIEPVKRDPSGGLYGFCLSGEDMQKQPSEVVMSLEDAQMLGDMIEQIFPTGVSRSRMDALIYAVVNAHVHGAQYIGPMWMALSISSMMIVQGGMCLDSLRDVISGDYLSEIDNWEDRLRVIVKEMELVIVELKKLEGA